METNPNVNVDSGGEATEVHTTVSFDDLVDAPPPVQEKPDEAGDDEKEATEGKDEGELAPTSEDTTDVGEDEEEDDGSDDVESPEKGPDPEKVEFRVLKGEYDGDEVEIAAETILPTKVAGKLEKPTVAELQDSYSGKINWDRKNSELVNREKAANEIQQKAESQISEVETRVGQLLEKSKEDPHAFLDVVAELHSIDPVKLKVDTFKAQLEKLEPLFKMSETERQTYLDKLEVRWEKERIATQHRIRDEEQATKELSSKVTEVCEQYEIPGDEYRECLSQAKEWMKGQDRKPEPTDVVFVHRHFMALEAFKTAGQGYIDSLDLQTESGQKTFNSALDDVRKLAMDNPDWKQKDLEEVIEGAFSEGTAERLSRKVSKTRSGKAQTAAPKKSKNKKVLTSFDQLD